MLNFRNFPIKSDSFLENLNKKLFAYLRKHFQISVEEAEDIIDKSWSQIIWNYENKIQSERHLEAALFTIAKNLVFTRMKI
ncbi:MAG: hypothetical protein HC880_04585 [Bacteroidia bacterium]|nr:hypothetical protein [Bacteroidia bacterium]